MQYRPDRNLQPRVISDWAQVYPLDLTKARTFYVLSWDTPNKEIGACRVSPIQSLNCSSKSLVITALKLAYNNAWPIRSFSDALDIIHGQGLSLLEYTLTGEYGSCSSSVRHL